MSQFDAFCEKFANFKGFIGTIELVNGPKISSHERFADFHATPVEAFIQQVVPHLIKNIDDLGGVLDRLLDQFELNKEHLRAEDYNRLIRYLQYFANACS